MCSAGAGRPAAGADEVQAESLQLLDWPALCAQVAAFASTPLAAEPLLRGRLPVGESQVRPPAQGAPPFRPAARTPCQLKAASCAAMWVPGMS